MPYSSSIVATTIVNAAEQAGFIRDSMPPGGLFAGLDWRISPEPFPLGENPAKEIESLGRVLLQFYRAVNLLYRRSVDGKQPEWIARTAGPRQTCGIDRSCNARRHSRTRYRASSDPIFF